MADQPMSCDQARDLAGGYVLGALDRAEEAAVRDHLASCDQPHPEFAALGGAVPALIEFELSENELVDPPATLRDRVMAAAAADLAANPRAVSPASATSHATVRDGATVARAEAAPESPTHFPLPAERAARAERRRTPALDWALRIAAVLAIVASGAWTLNVQGQLERARAFDSAVAAVVDAGAQPGAKTAVLAPQKGQHGSGIAAVRSDGAVVLALHDLAATNGTQTYTAWVIVGSTPVSVGDFRADANGTAAFTGRPATAPPGAVIAVTLEPNAGNTAPKGDVVSAGPAAAPPGAAG